MMWWNLSRVTITSDNGHWSNLACGNPLPSRIAWGHPILWPSHVTQPLPNSLLPKKGREMEICDNNVCHKVHRFLLVLFLDTQHTIISIWSLCFQYTKRRELWVAYALDESSMRLIIKSLLVKLPHGFILVFRGQVYTFVHLCGLGRSSNPRLWFSA